MQLRSFEGGLNTRVDASLILPNEAPVYQNIDNASLLLKSIKDFTASTTEIRGYFYNFNGEWLSSNGQRSYVEYNNVLYYTEENKKPFKYNGNQTSQMGIVGPQSKVTTTQQDPTASEKISASASTLQYTYTYYNVETGLESQPAPVSDELSLDADKVVDITGIVASTDLQVNRIRIYRIGDGTTSMTLVKEVANSANTIRDDVLTLDLIGTILDTYNNAPPPTDLRYIVEAYGTMFGVVGTRLYYSILGKPEYWPATSYIDFYKTIKGLLPVTNGILVFTENRTYILVGTTVTDFNKLVVSKEQGSVSHFTGQEVTNIPVWISKDGICAYQNGYVRVISREKLGKQSLNVINTVVHDEVYYIVKSDGSLLAMDARFSVIYKDIKLGSKIKNVAVSNDVLYANIGNKLATLFTGEEVSFTYKSPVLTDSNHSVTKLYNHVYIKSDGDINVKVYINGKEVLRKDLSGNDIHDITPPQEKQRGANIQFLITGIGKVEEIEYKVMGRQNGR